MTSTRFPVRWWWVVPILLLTSVLTTRHLLTDTYWFDELQNLIKMGIEPYPPVAFGDMITFIGETRWVPAYNIVLLGWGDLAGWTTFATRTLSLFMGVISVALMYRLGTGVYDRRAGFASAVLLGGSVYLIHYSHEMRGYSQYLMLTILSVYLYWKLVNQRRISRREQVAFVASFIVLMYSHYVAALVTVSIGLYHIIFERKSANWKNIFVLFIAVGLLYLPWIPITLLNTVGESLTSRGELTMFTIVESGLYAYSNGLTLVLVGLVIYSLAMIRTRAIRMLWFCLAVIFTLSMMFHLVIEFINNVRQIMSVFPLLIVLSGVAISHLSRRFNGVIWLVLVVWVVAGIYANRDLSFIEGMPGMLKNLSTKTMDMTVDIAETCVATDEVLVTHLTTEKIIWDPPVQEYYLWQTDFKYGMIDYMQDFSQGLESAESYGSYAENAQHLLEDAGRVWVVMSPVAHISADVKTLETTLANDYQYCAPFIETSDIIGIVYQNDTDFSCEVEQVSAPQYTSCAPTLLSEALEKQR